MANSIYNFHHWCTFFLRHCVFFCVYFSLRCVVRVWSVRAVTMSVAAIPPQDTGGTEHQGNPSQFDEFFNYLSPFFKEKYNTKKYWKLKFSDIWKKYIIFYLIQGKEIDKALLWWYPLQSHVWCVVQSHVVASIGSWVPAIECTNPLSWEPAYSLILQPREPTLPRLRPSTTLWWEDFMRWRRLRVPACSLS